MSAIDNARALVAYAKAELPKLEREYEKSLNDQEIRSDLLIEIKNVMENLRSALDYTAHYLFNRFGSSPKPSPRIYFPYANQQQSLTHFQSANRIEKCIPGLTAARPDIVAQIEGYQFFASPENEWLPLFMELNNSNKHQGLTPQKKQVRKQLNLDSNAGRISLGPGSSISLGPGSSIQMGGLRIPGGQSFSADNPPATSGHGSVQVVHWVSFHFDSNGMQVLPFMKQAIDGVDRIVLELGQK